VCYILAYIRKSRSKRFACCAASLWQLTLHSCTGPDPSKPYLGCAHLSAAETPRTQNASSQLDKGRPAAHLRGRSQLVLLAEHCSELLVAVLATCDSVFELSGNLRGRCSRPLVAGGTSGDRMLTHCNTCHLSYAYQHLQTISPRISSCIAMRCDCFED
jgi:hypothetical protein